jgi:hypothetical protein
MEGFLTAWRVHRFMAWLYGLGLLALLGYLYFAKHALPPHQVYSVVSALPILALFHALAARGSRLRQPWARIASLVMGCLLLVAFPVGTIAGVFLIWSCAHPWPDPRVHAGAPRGGWHQDARR